MADLSKLAMMFVALYYHSEQLLRYIRIQDLKIAAGRESEEAFEEISMRIRTAAVDYRTAQAGFWQFCSKYEISAQELLETMSGAADHVGNKNLFHEIDGETANLSGGGVNLIGVAAAAEGYNRAFLQVIESFEES